MRVVDEKKTCNPIHTGSCRSSLCLNLGNDKSLKPEILHTLKATQNKSFQATTVNIKDFSMARYLFCSNKCYRHLRKWQNSETQEVYLKLKFLLYWFHQIGIKEFHTKLQVINFIFTGVMTFLIFSKFPSTPRTCPKIRDKNTAILLQSRALLEMVRYIIYSNIKWNVKKFRQIWLSARKMAAV